MKRLAFLIPLVVIAIGVLGYFLMVGLANGDQTDQLPREQPTQRSTG